MVDKEGQLMRLIVAQPIVESCEDRRDFWTMLRSLAHEEEAPPAASVIDQARQDVVSKIVAELMQIAEESVGGSVEPGPAKSPSVVPPPVTPGAAQVAAAAPSKPAPPEGDYLAPWIEAINCTACDECIQINPKIFEYNADKKAVIKNAEGGPYKDIVKAAERCTARVIHPGLPRDRTQKGIEKLIKRAEKYN